jgi:metal-responsive CopG/Arc/MetJ family transcriptional regulator
MTAATPSDSRSTVVSITIPVTLLDEIDSAVITSTPPGEKPNRSKWIQRLVSRDITRSAKKGSKR